MKKKKIYITFILIIGVFTSSVILSNKGLNNNTVATSSELLPNEKIEWGIKRGNNHNQPDLGSENKELLDKYNGIAIGNNKNKFVYLTFDEGYEAGYTEKILEVLKTNQVPATFFITAHYVNTQDELVNKMIEQGHIVGNHTVNHKSMPELSEEEIKKEVMTLHQVIFEKYNYEMKYIRPPKGEFSQESIEETNKLGYKTVMWSFAYEDWNENKQPDEEKSKKMILDNLHNGEIILLHGNSKTNMNILDSVIKETKNMGYEFKSLDEFEK